MWERNRTGKGNYFNTKERKEERERRITISQTSKTHRKTIKEKGGKEIKTSKGKK
jgi:hypothetical protein